MIKRGVIIKLEKREAVVFNEMLEYEKIKRVEGMFEGQTVEYRTSQYENIYKKIKMLSGAAAVLVLIFSFYIWFATRAEPEIFAYVDLDINPSIEFSIDEKNVVIGLTPLNYDAQKIVRTLGKTRGKPIDEAIEYVIKRLQTEGFIKDKENQIILICSAPKSQGTSPYERKDSYKRLDKTMRLIKETLSKEKVSNLSVKTISINPEARKSSLENKMSMGRYALYESVNESGVKISLQKAKNAPLDELVSYLTGSNRDFTNNVGGDTEGTTALNELSKSSGLPTVTARPHQSTKSNNENKNDTVTDNNDFGDSEINDKIKGNSEEKYTYWGSNKEEGVQVTQAKDITQETPKSSFYTPAATTVTPAAMDLHTAIYQSTPYPTSNSGSTPITVTTPGMQPVKSTPTPTRGMPSEGPKEGERPPDDEDRNEHIGDKHGKGPFPGTEPGKPPGKPNITPGTIPTWRPVPTLIPEITPGSKPTWVPGGPISTPAVPSRKPDIPPEDHKMPPPPNATGIIPKTTPGPIRRP